MLKMVEKPKAMKPHEGVDPEAPKQLDFSFKSVKKKPSRRYRKGSKYDPVLDAFLAQDRNLVSIELEGKEANYIRTQLNKRIEAVPKYKNIKISVVNNIAYLERE